MRPPRAACFTLTVATAIPVRQIPRLTADPSPWNALGRRASCCSVPVIAPAGEAVFVKLVRLTDVERAAGSDCTQNLFALPTWYQYGVGEGSAGFNALREVGAHQTVTGWICNLSD